MLRSCIRSRRVAWRCWTATWLLLALIVPLPAHAQSVPDTSPLPDCPDSPNCEHVARTYDDVSASRLFDAARAALQSLGPTEMDVSPDSTRAHAVYRVALVFKDDVDVAVREDGPTLFVRSASRVGYSDLGVNRRRVERFFAALNARLDVE